MFCECFQAFFTFEQMFGVFRDSILNWKLLLWNNVCCLESSIRIAKQAWLDKHFRTKFLPTQTSRNGTRAWLWKAIFQARKSTWKTYAFVRGTGRFTANPIADKTGVFNVISCYLWDNEQNVLYTVKHHKPSKQNASLKIAALLEKEKIFQVKRHHRPQIDRNCTLNFLW